MSDLGEVARFTTDAVPVRDRMDFWRESFGRKVMGLDMEPAEEEPLHFDITRRSLGNIAVVSARTSGHRARRTPDLLADNNSDQVLVMPSHRNVVVRARGREVMVKPGQAFLMGLNEAGCAEQPPVAESARPESFVHIQFPREVLSPLVPNIDDLMLAVISERNEALRLLRNYVGLINNGDRLVTENTAHSVSSHILDLAALAIGGAADAMVQARRHGLGAARLASIKAYVRMHAGDPGLTVADVARYSGISASYVWRLFASDGDSYSGYLLEQRLERAWRMLVDPDCRHLRISAIAYKAGFGDLSYFNRTFRRRYGMTPSDARIAAIEADKP